MYKYDNGQISIDEFGQPVGMKLQAENRRVKKAMTIPWGAIEHRYAALFTNQKGNVAKPLRLGLGACIIQMVYFRKRLTPEILGEINEKDYLSLVRTRKPGQKKIRKAIGKQLGYLARNLRSIDTFLSAGKLLTAWQQLRLETIRKVYEQQKSMYDARNHTVPDRIVSLSQPCLRPIVRGKAKASVEFGAKLDISVVNGWTRLEVYSFDACNEAGRLAEMIERYHARTKRYPSRVLADKIYRNRSNIAYCKERGIRLSGPALGRPPKDVQPDKKQNYIDECERVEVERRFSLAKRVCGLGLITARLKETACHCIAMSFLVLNLRKVQCAFLAFWCSSLALLFPMRKSVFVQ